MMKASIATRMLSAAAAVSVVALVALPARADVLEKTKKVGGVTVEYKVVLPSGYDPTKAYPGIIALGGGPQTMNTVDGVLGRNFRAEAEKRGYIVVAPAAPDGQLFFQNGGQIFPEFLTMILGDYKIQDGKFHIAGPSNGGIASFHVAAANPQYFISVTAFPGYMWEPTPARLQAIAKLCVFMYVGETDEYRWHDEMKREAEFLRSKGAARALHGREGPATPVGDARRCQRRPAVRRIRRSEERLQQVAASGRVMPRAWAHRCSTREIRGSRSEVRLKSEQPDSAGIVTLQTSDLFMSWSVMRLSTRILSPLLDRITD